MTAFIDLINTIGTIGNLNDASKCQVTRLKLRGSAREFLESDPRLGVTVDWGTLSTALLERFRPRETQHTIAQKFTQAKQKPGESVQNFATRVRRLAHQWNESLGVPATQQEKETRRRILAISTKDNFCRGLNDAIRRFVLARCPQDLDAAISAAIEESLSSEMDAQATVPIFGITQTQEHGQGPRANQEGPGPRSGASHAGAGRGANSTQQQPGVAPRGPAGRGSSQWAGRGASSSGPRRFSGNCYRCGKPNHAARECRTPWEKIGQVSNLPSRNNYQGNANRIPQNASRGRF